MSQVRQVVDAKFRCRLMRPIGKRTGRDGNPDESSHASSGGEVVERETVDRITLTNFSVNLMGAVQTPTVSATTATTTTTTTTTTMVVAGAHSTGLVLTTSRPPAVGGAPFTTGYRPETLTLVFSEFVRQWMMSQSRGCSQVYATEYVAQITKLTVETHSSPATPRIPIEDRRISDPSSGKEGSGDAWVTANRDETHRTLSKPPARAERT